MCGGSSGRRAIRVSSPGASPRVRGKLLAGKEVALALRCIPACAGEALDAHRGLNDIAVHPRVCGGSSESTGVPTRAGGASPRVRGKRERAGQLRGGVWCIPACAGEAMASAPRASSIQVHPRVCGGSESQTENSIFTHGASPRVRGKHAGVAPPSDQEGCIPACAGEARRGKCRCPPPRVHPRVCGGSGIFAHSSSLTSGASPRVRGKPALLVDDDLATRCIPACAGEALFG